MNTELFPRWGGFHRYPLTIAAHWLREFGWGLRWTGFIVGPLAFGVIWRERLDAGPTTTGADTPSTHGGRADESVPDEPAERGPLRRACELLIVVILSLCGYVLVAKALEPVEITPSHIGWRW